MYIFLSYKINQETPAYGGKKGFISEIQNSIEQGDSANTSFWNFSNHLGTHIDFPNHFYKNGQTLDDFSPDFWIYNRKDIQILETELPKNELLIKPNYIINRYNQKAKVVFLKTNIGRYRNQKKYWKQNPGISPELVDWLRQTFHKIKIFGLDSISVSSWQHREIGRHVHKKFLNPDAPIILIEDMDLSKINQKTDINKLIIAPFRVSRENGCPCTIFADVK